MCLPTSFCVCAPQVREGMQAEQDAQGGVTTSTIGLDKLCAWLAQVCVRACVLCDAIVRGCGVCFSVFFGVRLVPSLKAPHHSCAHRTLMKPSASLLAWTTPLRAISGK